MNPERMGNPRHVGDAHTDIWLTPRFILDALGSFDLDPCAPLVQPWPTAASSDAVTRLEGDGARKLLKLLPEWRPFYAPRLLQ